MQISNNLTNKLNLIKTAKALPNKQSVTFGNNTQQLPSIYAAGTSQVNTNLPVSYSLIGEIPIPGLKDKASVFKLSNGQRVVILPKKGPTQIKTTFNVGSLNETEDIRGMSHYIEHNLFNGSKGLAPKEYDKRVSDMGGYTNASTSYDVTDYYLTMQLLDDSCLEEGIRINAAQTQFPTFPHDQLEKEKEAVKSEIDVYKDITSSVAQSIVTKNLFGINTQSSNFVLGTKQNINSFNQSKVLDYYNTWYTPDNAVTVITGDVDVKETINLVSKYFNKRPDYSKISQRHYEPITYLTKPVRADIIQKGSPFSNITMGFAIPEATPSKERTNINILLNILSNKNSRLSKALDKYGLSPDFYRTGIQNKPNSAEELTLSLNLPEEHVEEVLKILYDEIAYIANNPPSTEEFTQTQNSMLQAFGSIGEYSEDINAILTQMVIKNDYNYINTEWQNVVSATPKDISQAAKKIMDLNKVSICVAHAEDSTADTIMGNYNKVNTPKQISFGKSNPLSNIQSDISKIKEYKLWNNIETMIVPASSSGKSSFQMSIQTDTMKDISYPALRILTEMLNRGSSAKDVDSFNRNLTKNNIDLVFEANSEGINIHSAFYDDKMNSALDMIKEVIAIPNLSEAEFQRAKQNLKAELETSQKSALGALYKEIFSDIKAYSTPQEQLIELDKLTLADIQRLYARILSNSQCEVTCTLPVEDKPYLADILNNTLSSGMPCFQPAIINREANTHIFKPNMAPKTIAQAEERIQAEIVQAYTYKKSYNIDDDVKIKLLNIILGEGMSSRLFLSLREQEKLCYAVNSKCDYQDDTGVIRLRTLTTTDSPNPSEGSPDNAIKAINAFKHNIEMLKTQPITPEELKQAKTKLKSDILNNREANYDTNNQMHNCRNSAYGLKYPETYYAAIDKITVEDIMAAANYVFQNPPVTSIVASQKTLDAINL